MLVILFFAILSIAQTIWFYAGGALGWTSGIVTSVLALIAVFFIHKKYPLKKLSSRATSDGTEGPLRWILLAVSIVSLALIIRGALHASTVDSIRTPWPLLALRTLPLIAVTWITFALSLWFSRSKCLQKIHAAIALFATTSIAPLVYRLGFGFDGFLHVAAEKIILTTGTLNPKPFYYIGQYVLTTWLSRLTTIPIESIDRWLVPVAFTVLIPLALDEAAFGLFLLPLAPFVATTPQSFAYVLGLAALLLARKQKVPAIILAIWSVAVHPLAGLPLLCVTLALIVRNKIASWSLVVASAVIVPILFLIIGHGATAIGWNILSLVTPKPWADFFGQFIPWLSNRYVLWPAWATLVEQSLPFLLLAAAIESVRLQKKSERQPYALLITAALLLFLSATILKTAGDFAFLIDYERGNYADRLNLLALFCLFPAALPSIAWLFERARKNIPVGIPFFAGCLLIATAMSYNALPRHDALIVGHGWSVGQSDVAAVRAIDQDANGRAYTVLADQSVSAAAISQFGFKRYNGDTFYYPIPTGGALYNDYLKMTYGEPSRDIARDAARLGGSSIVYVVLNDYWWNADKLADKLTMISDEQWTFGDPTKGLGHSVTVYKFDFNK